MLVRMLWPGMLWALLLLPVAVAAYLFGQRRHTSYAARFTNLDLLANVVHRSPGWRRHLPAALYLLALAGLLLALARPQATVLVPKQQANVILIMDVSGSMNAVDVAPSRLTAAIGAASRFVDRLPSGFRVGLISFSTTAQLITPPTTDRQAVHDALGGLRAEGSTAIGDAIERALDLRRPPPTTSSGAPAIPRPTPDPALRSLPMVLLLLSDGANTAGRTPPQRAADDAHQLGVPIYTIALGTQNGTVEVPDERTQQLRITPVPPDPGGLQDIAQHTGGLAFTAPTAENLERIYRQIGTRIGFIRQDQELTVAFTAAAMLALVAGGALSLIWFRRIP
jgi:Ca-activated chloride channel family protein